MFQTQFESIRIRRDVVSTPLSQVSTATTAVDILLFVRGRSSYLLPFWIKIESPAHNILSLPGYYFTPWNIMCRYLIMLLNFLLYCKTCTVQNKLCIIIWKHICKGYDKISISHTLFTFCTCLGMRYSTHVCFHIHLGCTVSLWFLISRIQYVYTLWLRGDCAQR